MGDSSTTPADMKASPNRATSLSLVDETQAAEPAIRLRGLTDLPVELLYDILILSACPSLPVVSRRLHAVCTSAPPGIRARYIISSFLALTPPTPAAPPPLPPDDDPLPQEFIPSVPPSTPASHVRTTMTTTSTPMTPRAPPQSRWILAYALRFPICTLPVFQALERLWDPSSGKYDGKGAESTSRPMVDLDSALWTLPKRLFRSLPACRSPSISPSSPPAEGDSSYATPSTDPYPLLHHILTKYPFNADSHQGYPLAMAVKAPHLPLVRLLLTKRANPGLREGVAVRIAVAKRDLGLVRMLIERREEEELAVIPPAVPSGAPGTDTAAADTALRTAPSEEMQGKRGKRKSRDADGEGRKRKRRRLSDRVQVNPAWLQLAVKLDARDIVEYLMEKGCVPDMKTLRMVR